ncbi:hypothetical protein JXB31_04930 [Candidatus Woesearchaeota archaeon]|nr:hypothetical protein [Candidatus Woesearchaeota archaeon]
MKKIYFIGLSIMLLGLLFLSGCGNKETETNTNQESELQNLDSTTATWPADMPKQVPKFTYGAITGSEVGMDSWIVDFENVNPDAMDKYVSDLKSGGWTASFMEINGMMTGKHSEGFSISGNYDKEYKVFQLIVRKAEPNSQPTGSTSVEENELSEEFCPKLTTELELTNEQCIAVALKTEEICSEDTGGVDYDSCLGLRFFVVLVEEHPELKDEVTKMFQEANN